MQYTAQICRNKEQQLCYALLPCAAVHFCMACRRPSFKERPAWTWSCWSIHMNTTTINQTCRPRFICPKYLWGRVVNALIKGVLQMCPEAGAVKFVPLQCGKQIRLSKLLCSNSTAAAHFFGWLWLGMPLHRFKGMVIFKTTSLPQTVLKAVQLLGEILSSESVTWSNVIGSHWENDSKILGFDWMKLQNNFKFNSGHVKTHTYPVIYWNGSNNGSKQWSIVEQHACR